MINSEELEEIFDLVDEEDKVIGKASRGDVHGNPSLIHRVAHVLVFNSRGELFLQKRSMTKDVQPGKWDTSVGGHVDAGESYEKAAVREMREELGIQSVQVEFLYTYMHRNAYESEYVQTYRCTWDGGITVHSEEIDEGRFWSLEEISNNDLSVFTPNFMDELERFRNLSEG